MRVGEGIQESLQAATKRCVDTLKELQAAMGDTFMQELLPGAQVAALCLLKKKKKASHDISTSVCQKATLQHREIKWRKRLCYDQTKVSFLAITLNAIFGETQALRGL